MFCFCAPSKLSKNTDILTFSEDEKTENWRKMSCCDLFRSCDVCSLQSQLLFVSSSIFQILWDFPLNPSYFSKTVKMLSWKHCKLKIEAKVLTKGQCDINLNIFSKWKII